MQHIADFTPKVQACGGQTT